MEFPLLHDKIVSYRRYYLIRSEKIVGDLYNIDGTIVATEVKWYYFIYLKATDEEPMLYLQRDRLYLEEKPLLSNVKSIARMDDDNYFVIMEDGHRLFLTLQPDSGEYEIRLNLWGDPYDATLLQIGDLHIDIGAKDEQGKRVRTAVTWLLLSSGTLYYYIEGQPIEYTTGVTEIIFEGNKYLYVVYSNGQLEFISMDENKAIVSFTMDNSNYIKGTIIGDTLFAFRDDGAVDRYTHPIPLGFGRRQKKVLPMTLRETITAPTPIRAIFIESNTEEQIIVEINGDGYCELHNSVLPSRVKTIYQGIIELGDDDHLIAVGKN